MTFLDKKSGEFKPETWQIVEYLLKDHVFYTCYIMFLLNFVSNACHSDTSASTVFDISGKSYRFFFFLP